MTRAPQSDPQPTLRSFGLASATAVLISNMVGTGVFTSLGFQVVDLSSGFALLALWAVGGLLALSGALCYAELGAMYPRSGGEYVYLTEAWSPRLGFIGGFVSMTAGFAAPIAIAAMAFGRYAAQVLPVAPMLATAAVLALVAVVQWSGVSLARQFQVATTGSTLLIIAAFIVTGLVIGPVEPLSFAPDAEAFRQIATAPFAISLIYVVYAYTGWNAIGYVAGEVAEPQRTIPRAVVGAVLLVALLYLTLHFVFLRTVPLDALRGTVEVASLSATRILGVAGGRVMSALIALVLVATISGFLLAGSRVTQAVGEGTARLAWLGARGGDGVPRRALALQLALIALLIATASFETVLAYAGIVLNLMNLLAVAGLMKLRRAAPALARPFRTPLYPLVPLTFAALSTWMIAFVIWQRPSVILAALGTLVAGSALYSFVSRR
ncbi:amino acid permease [Pseudogemmatithrix spongiicola]|uniref:Amino acid permease n=1 Tax=Pseudogemmatithrix spongiicola TaxID=3062599 RepID=A0AA49Q7K8_9BACT|nr:amino acid permease [Gemmatimonadaceae bacterium 'strain 138']WKW15823.1 amino acid permease [Gemmatimonadaceae bacterium 'strain 318']